MVVKNKSGGNIYMYIYIFFVVNEIKNVFFFIFIFILFKLVNYCKNNLFFFFVF